MNSTKKRLVACPTCGKQAEYDLGNPFRPFCSQRCKLIDLGQWASESFRISETPAKEEPEHEE